MTSCSNRPENVREFVFFQSKNISNFNIDFTVLQTQQQNTVKNRLAQKTAARSAYCLAAIVQGGAKTVDHWRATVNRL